jgi:hypothetical protein
MAAVGTQGKLSADDIYRKLTSDLIQGRRHEAHRFLWDNLEIWAPHCPQLIKRAFLEFNAELVSELAKGAKRKLMPTLSDDEKAALINSLERIEGYVGTRFSVRCKCKKDGKNFFKRYHKSYNKALSALRQVVGDRATSAKIARAGHQ